MNTTGYASLTDVTVGIPFYALVPVTQFKQAVDSILGQTFKPTNIHLIQDGPVPDDLAAAVKEYVQSYANIRHLYIEKQSGLAYAANISILHSPTKYYARMDADDIAHPQRLEKQVNYLELHPNIDILGTWVKEFYSAPTEDGFVKKLPHDPVLIEEFFHYRNPLAHPTVMFRRESFAKMGLYDYKFLTECDLEMWGRALNMGVRIDNLEEVLLYFRMVGVVRRRSEPGRVWQQIRARYRHNTWSIKLNTLKVLAIVFRLLPVKVQQWGYHNLRNT